MAVPAEVEKVIHHTINDEMERIEACLGADLAYFRKIPKEKYNINFRSGFTVNGRTFPMSLLHFAIAIHKIEMIELFCDKGIGINTKIRGFTPLHLSCWLNYIDCVDTLLCYNADINIRDDQNMTPLDLAVSLEHTDVVRAILHRTVKPDYLSLPLQIAIRLNNFEIAKELMFSGADPNIPNITGKKPIDCLLPDQTDMKQIITEIKALPTTKTTSRLSQITPSMVSMSELINEATYNFRHRLVVLHKVTVNEKTNL